MPSARSYENISTNGARHSKAHGITVIENLTFTEADKAANFRFEPSRNLDSTIASMLATYGVEGTIQRLEVAGDPTGDFKLIWDYIDDITATTTRRSTNMPWNSGSNMPNICRMAGLR